jgi:hypothetical protein
MRINCAHERARAKSFYHGTRQNRSCKSIQSAANPKPSSLQELAAEKTPTRELEGIEESLAAFCRLIESNARDPSTSSG